MMRRRQRKRRRCDSTAFAGWVHCNGDWLLVASAVNEDTCLMLLDVHVERNGLPCGTPRLVLPRGMFPGETPRDHESLAARLDCLVHQAAPEVEAELRRAIGVLVQDAYGWYRRAVEAESVLGFWLEERERTALVGSDEQLRRFRRGMAAIEEGGCNGV